MPKDASGLAVEFYRRFYLPEITETLELVAEGFDSAASCAWSGGLQTWIIAGAP